ncbi:hypothetical protein GW17_00035123 [Ensete ventricosum]|nr:hypothetical protein GW17_00035123 [Ensete ventricosum]
MIKLGGLLKHQSITILIDTRSTNNFMNIKIATRIVLHIEDCSRSDVKVDDGRILKCDRRCPHRSIIWIPLERRTLDLLHPLHQNLEYRVKATRKGGSRPWPRPMQGPTRGSTHGQPARRSYILVFQIQMEKMKEVKSPPL